MAELRIRRQRAGAAPHRRRRSSRACTATCGRRCRPCAGSRSSTTPTLRSASTPGSRSAPASPASSRSASCRARPSRLFAAVHRNTPRGLRVRLEGTGYDEWIVGCADPEAVAAGLGLPGGPEPGQSPPERRRPSRVRRPARARSSGERRSAPAATFSATCAGLPVPGMTSTWSPGVTTTPAGPGPRSPRVPARPRPRRSRAAAPRWRPSPAIEKNGTNATPRRPHSARIGRAARADAVAVLHACDRRDGLGLGELLGVHAGEPEVPDQPGLCNSASAATCSPTVVRCWRRKYTRSRWSRPS